MQLFLTYANLLKGINPLAFQHVFGTRVRTYQLYHDSLYNDMEDNVLIVPDCVRLLETGIEDNKLEYIFLMLKILKQ